jgi:hypothetical protein
MGLHVVYLDIRIRKCRPTFPTRSSTYRMPFPFLSPCDLFQAVIAGISTAETGGNIANLLFSLCLIFCG